jgi:SagB-type dehydrogenase family enzyme
VGSARRDAKARRLVWHWAYRLQAPAATRAPRGQALAWQALQAGFVTERMLARPGAGAAAPLLLQLDRQGHLQRELRLGSQAWARVLPQRAPDKPPPPELPEAPLRLIDTCVVHAGAEGLTLEAPGGWARVQLLRPELPALLQALARGCSAVQAGKSFPGAEAGVQELLRMLLWCGLLASPTAPTNPTVGAWAAHDLWLHSRTRRGYGRAAIGKLEASAAGAAVLPGGPRTALHKGHPDDLAIAFGDVLSGRRSIRQPGAGPLALQALAQVLWHALAVKPQAGRPHRPYPSGGSCYALQPFLLVSRCAGLQAGLYAYDAQAHALVQQPTDAAALGPLLGDAMASAHITSPPQVLLVLCADYARMRGAYGDLGYSLLLKEVGAVMQTLQLVATALGLACCPLGTGDALNFARLACLDPLRLPAVGEVLLGTAA